MGEQQGHFLVPFFTAIFVQAKGKRKQQGSCVLDSMTDRNRSNIVPNHGQQPAMMRTRHRWQQQQRQHYQQRQQQRNRITIQAIGVCAMIGIIVNAFVLHGQVEDSNYATYHHHQHLYSKKDDDSTTSASQGARSSRFHNLNPNLLGQTTQQQERLPVKHHNLRHLWSDSPDHAAEGSTAVLLLLRRVRDAQKRHWETCRRQGLTAREPPTEDDGNDVGISFGLWKALSNDPLLAQVASLPQVKKPPSLHNNSNNPPTSICVVLVVTSLGDNLRRLFINHLKWLNLESIPPRSPPLPPPILLAQQAELATAQQQAIPRVIIEQLWLLLPSNVSTVLETDSNYGQRFLAWDQQVNHVVQVRYGNSFWDAVMQVQPPPSALTATTNSSQQHYHPIVFLNGDIDSPSGEPLRHWSHQHLQQWYASPSSSAMWSATAQIEPTTRAVTGVSVREDAPIRSAVLGRGPDTSFTCGGPTTTKPPNRISLVLPQLHLSIQDSLGVGLLQPPVLAYVRNQTGSTSEWKLAELAAALWLAWLSSSSSETIVGAGNHRQQQQQGKPYNGGGTSTSSHPPYHHDDTFLTLNENDRRVLSGIIDYFGGIPTEFLSSME